MASSLTSGRSAAIRSAADGRVNVVVREFADRAGVCGTVGKQLPIPIQASFVVLVEKIGVGDRRHEAIGMLAKELVQRLGAAAVGANEQKVRPRMLFQFSLA